jgi:hypothetical protein
VLSKDIKRGPTNKIISNKIRHEFQYQKMKVEKELNPSSWTNIISIFSGLSIMEDNLFKKSSLYQDTPGRYGHLIPTVRSKDSHI